MKASLVLGAGRGPRLAVLEEIKRSDKGMSVGDMASALQMSYMGVKSHCIALESTGHLTTWREPGTRGRPRLLYRLSDAGKRLFEERQDHLALDLLREAAGLFGSTAPQKLMLMYFRSRTVRYQGQISAGEVLGRAEQLAALRDREGRMSIVTGTNPREIRESHNPLHYLMQEYPEARSMEEHLFSEVLGVPVKRSEQQGKVVFSWGG